MDSISYKIREDILKIAHQSGHGHIPTCFSIVEMLRSIYLMMNHNPYNPDWDQRDIFILSKGHAALSHYCILAHEGYFPVEELYGFGAFNSRFGCHADRQKVPGVEWSTGSLGHGISVAVGIALAMKLESSSRKVFVIIGDGESNEGTVWESILVAANLKLDNLVVLFDNNQSQARCLPISRPEEKFKAFDCETFRVNGHDVDELVSCMKMKTTGKPNVIVSDTLKGWGCKTLVDNMFAWHRRSPTENELKQLLKELK